MTDSIPHTYEQVKDHFELNGFRTIPIKFEGLAKKPHPSFTHEKLESGKYEYSVDGIDGIAMVHGPISGTFAIDIDFKQRPPSSFEAISILFNDPEKTCKKTLVVKTPKQGVHFVFKCMDGNYPEQKKYTSKKYPGVEIDIRSTHGYTLIPPSSHPEKKYGKYMFLSETLEPAPMRWSDVLVVFAERGFFSRDETEYFERHDLESLMAGNFERGNRRRSENSLYCKLRIRGSTVQQAQEKVRQTNARIAEPLDESELQYNFKYAEAFYENHIVPGLKKPGSGPKKRKFKHYHMASQIAKSYDFVSHISGEIYYYSGGIYHRNGERLIRKKCRQYWEPIGIETKDVTEITNIIRDKTTILDHDESEDIFDLDYRKIVLKNGIYDIDRNAIIPHTSAIRCLIKHPIFYDGNKKCPKFDAFIDSCFEGDGRRISQAIEMMALCFLKENIVQKGFVNYGIGSNGKSTFLRILTNMLGKRNTSSIAMQDFQRNQFMGFDLRAKNANISYDGGTEPIIKTGMIKSILGGDYIRCEEKHKSAFIFKPFSTLVFTFNELPPVYDSSDGFARKIQTIHWHRKFHGNNCNPEVEKIAWDSAELSGIFNKLIPVMKKLIKNRRLTHEDTVDQTKEIWLSRSDSFFKFKNEKLVIGNYAIHTEKLRVLYGEFCKENGMTPIPKRVFNEKISDMIGGEKPRVTRNGDHQYRVWFGISVDSEIRDAKQTAL